MKFQIVSSAMYYNRLLLNIIVESDENKISLFVYKSISEIGANEWMKYAIKLAQKYL